MPDAVLDLAIRPLFAGPSNEDLYWHRTHTISQVRVVGLNPRGFVHEHDDLTSHFRNQVKL